MREKGVAVDEVNVQLKFSRPARKKVGITMCEYFDVEELKKDLAAVHRLDSTAWPGMRVRERCEQRINHLFEEF